MQMYVRCGGILLWQRGGEKWGRVGMFVAARRYRASELTTNYD